MELKAQRGWGIKRIARHLNARGIPSPDAGRTRTDHGVKHRVSGKWCPGTVGELRIPGGNGVRFDTLLYPGYTIPPFYDSLLGKLIVWDEDRRSALARLLRALKELEIGGVKTTCPLHLALAADPAVDAAEFHTRWLEGWLESNAVKWAAQ